METIFRKGDKVFSYQHGWGYVKSVSDVAIDFPVHVYFEDIDEGLSFTHNGEYDINHKATLSFTEYKLEGFTQERPEPLPKQGDVVWVRDTKHGMWIVMHFIKKSGVKYVVSNNNPFTYSHTEYDEYNYLTTKNPYTNENASI